jgi:hypothetical protein
LNNHKDKIVEFPRRSASLGRFVPCANGWLFKGTPRRHYIQIVDDDLQCSCNAFKTSASHSSCEHTRQAHKLLATGKLARPKTIMLPLIFAPT